MTATEKFVENNDGPQTGHRPGHRPDEPCKSTVFFTVSESKKRGSTR
jgi:hypothetical protein